MSARVLAVALTVALVATARAEAGRVRPALVRGLEGQPHLLLDVGRRVDRLPPRPPRGSLRPIEKARLDARRVWLASSLSAEERMLRLVAIVRTRMPSTPAALLRYRSLGTGTVRLSALVADKTGVCRERAFLSPRCSPRWGSRRACATASSTPRRANTWADTPGSRHGCAACAIWST